MATRQIFFTISDVVGAATGSYSMIDGDGISIFSNVDYRLLNGVTYSVNATQSTFYLINNNSPINITYTTWNPNDASSNLSLSTNNLTVTKVISPVANVRTTIGKSSGKWYWEIRNDSSSGIFDLWEGVANSAAGLSALPGSADVNGWAIAIDGSDYYHNGFLGTAGGPGVRWPSVTGDVMGFALDMDAGSLTVYQNNNILSPNPLFTGITGTVYPILSTQFDTTVSTAYFGASGMSYSTPSGFNTGLYN